MEFKGVCFYWTCFPDVRKIKTEVLRQNSSSFSGFSISGMQNGTDCFCGHYFGEYGQIPDESCDILCPGSRLTVFCGGVLASSIYYVKPRKFNTSRN